MFRRFEDTEPDSVGYVQRANAWAIFCGASSGETAECILVTALFLEMAANYLA